MATVSGLRGIVGDGLDPASAVEFAAAYAAGCAPGAIVVGHDGRASAPVFVHAVQAAVTATGRDVLFAGPTATPTIGRLVRDLGAAGGVQISASHNPPEYNGLKFFQPEGMVLSPEQGRGILSRLGRREFRWARWDGVGKVHQLDDPDASHLRAILAIVDADAIRARRFRVLLDAAHGAGGRLGYSLLRALGCEPLIIGGMPDGLYDHPPEPTKTNLQRIAPLVPAAGAAVGFAQDPDADRLAIIDETGRYIGEELTLALAARQRLADARGVVVINLSTSRAVEDVAARLGSTVHRTPVGEIHVVERMRSERAVLGGEGNGGVIDPRIGFVRDSFVGMALVLDLLARGEASLSMLVDALPQYAMVKERYPVPDGTPLSDLFDQIARAHPDARPDLRDGLRLDWSDCWAQVRPSNTEPIVRVIVEAEDRERAQELASFLGRWITAGGRP
jgi:phosphomannomutase